MAPKHAVHAPPAPSRFEVELPSGQRNQNSPDSPKLLEPFIVRLVNAVSLSQGDDRTDLAAIASHRADGLAEPSGLPVIQTLAPCYIRHQAGELLLVSDSDRTGAHKTKFG